MGSIAQPFAVNITQVRQTFGSKDRALLEKVKQSNLYENYAEGAEDCDFDEILEDIIVRYIKPEDRQKTGGLLGLFKSNPGSGLNPKLAHHYGYALIVICDTLGTFLSKGGDIFYSGDVWKEANKWLKSKGITIDLDRMWQTEKLFDIPKIADFPVISHYANQEVSYLLQALNKHDLNDITTNNDNVQPEELQELLLTFRNGLQICSDKQVEWVSFLH